MIDDEDDFKEAAGPKQKGVAKEVGGAKKKSRSTKSKRKRKQVLNDSGQSLFKNLPPLNQKGDREGADHYNFFFLVQIQMVMLPQRNPRPRPPNLQRNRLWGRARARLRLQRRPNPPSSLLRRKGLRQVS